MPFMSALETGVCLQPVAHGPFLQLQASGDQCSLCGCTADAASPVSLVTLSGPCAYTGSTQVVQDELPN